MEEVDQLVKRSQQLEVEVDKAKEELALMEEKLKEKEDALNAGELELSNLNRSVQAIEGDLEDCDDKLVIACTKLEKAETAGDDSDRMRKVLEAKVTQHLQLNYLLCNYKAFHRASNSPPFAGTAR